RQMMPTLEWAAGTENVHESALITGAEDFSFFQERMPGLFLMLGINDPDVPRSERPSNHSPFFIAEDGALMTGVRTLVGFALDYAAATDD
ncbi:MAG: amidohydrolase, partial [Gammaproteobacteria bacterium]|nr:amidohydrolase [Gammaproteobacteria bacterium]